MSSLGGQWRALRHLLTGGLQAEAAPLHRRWDDLIRRLEKAISVRLMQDSKELNEPNGVLKAATDANVTKEDIQMEEKKDVPAAPAAPSAPAAPASAAELETEARDITIASMLQGLRRRKDIALGNISDSSWKSNKPVVNKSSIHSRTAYVISALVSAESSACLAKRTADFIHHVHQYPEARDLAIKEGAVRALLRVQRRARGEAAAERDVRGLVREALALMGYAGAPPGPGPRVLALDGGGIRGLIAIEVLRHLERLTGRRVHELFDYIIGVSTGAIIAAVIGSGAGTLETASAMYHTLSKEMFGNTSVIGGTSRLVWTHSYYDTAKWEKMLRDHLGDITLTECNRRNNPKMALVSCVVNPGARLSPFVFRTYSCRYRTRGAVHGSSAARVWQAVRASAAAPTYFDEFRHAGLVHQDGGIVANNPAGLALHEARLLWGGAALRRGLLLSLGCGAPPAPAPPPAPHGTSWRDKFYKILDSATDTEAVHLLLNELLPAGRYFRFNPPLMQACAMDEVRAERLRALLADTAAYIRRNQHKFELAAALLTARRSPLQRAADAARHRALLLGLTDRH